MLVINQYELRQGNPQPSLLPFPLNRSAGGKTGREKKADKGERETDKHARQTAVQTKKRRRTGGWRGNERGMGGEASIHIPTSSLAVVARL